MIFASKSSRDVYNELRSNLEAMGITNFSESSIANILLTAVSNNYRENVQAIQAALNSMDFLTANGQDLDTIASLFSIVREQPKRAVSNSVERNFKFYVATGTFGDLNGGDDIVVPKNSIIYYESRDRTRRIEYRTKEAVTLAAAASSTYFGAESVAYGKASNVSKLIVANHSLAYPSLLVNNTYPVINGADLQTDESLRYQISIQAAAKNGNGLDAMRRLLAPVEGINEYRVIPFYEGIGSFAFIIDFFDNEVAPSYVDSIARRLSEKVSGGEKLIVKRVTQMKMTFTLEIVPASSLAVATSDITSVIREAFGEMTIGSSLNLSTLMENIADLDSISSIVGNDFAAMTLTYVDSDLNETLVAVTGSLLEAEEDAKLSLATDFLVVESGP